VWQAHFGGNVDEALLNLHLLWAAAESEERYLDAIERPPQAVAVSEVAHHQLQRERCTSIVDEHVTSLSGVTYEGAGRLATLAKRGGDALGNPTGGSGYEDFGHVVSLSWLMIIMRPVE